MQKNKNISLAKQGMLRDAAKDSINEQGYTIAYNMNMENQSGELYKLKSEFSNILASKFKEGFKLIKAEPDELNNRTFVFLTNPDTNVSEIGTIENNRNITKQDDEIAGCVECDKNKVLAEPLEETEQTEHQVYVTKFEDSCNKCLNFDIRYPIKKVVIKNEKSGTKVFFTDNYNPPRYFDEGNELYFKQTGSEVCDTNTIEDVCVNCDRMRMFPLASPLRLEPETLTLGGNLKLGQYSFYGAYANSLGEEMSEYTSLTNPVSIFDENNKILTNIEEQERTNFAIKLSVSDLDEKYDYYKIVVAFTNVVDGGTRYFDIGTFPITNTTVLFTTEQDKKDLSINDILLPNTNIKLIEGLTEVNDYLVGYGITREKEWNLQPIANLLGGFLRWQSHITTEDFYEDGVNVSLYKQYMRDEVYPISLRFFTNTGYTTAKFPLVARPATDDDLTEVDNKDVESLNANLTNCTSGARDKKWQIYNTASVLGDCSVGDIPTNTIVEPVVKTSITSLGNTGPGSFVIEDVEEFTTLEDFINQSIEDGCYNLPFCSTADPTSVPDEAPTFDDCDTPYHDPSEDVVEVVSITGEELNYSYVEFPDDYRRLVSSTYCSPYQVDSEGEIMEDEEFQDEYFPGTNHVPYRNYTFTNDKPRNAKALVPVSNTSDAVTELYFHDYLGYKGTSAADAVDAVVETGFTGVATDSGSGYDGRPYAFDSTLHQNGLWFEVDLNEYPYTILEILEGVKVDGTDIVPVTDNIRISFFEGTSTPQVALYSVIYNVKNGVMFKVDYDEDTETLTLEDESNTLVINQPSYQNGITKKKLYFVIDCALSIERLASEYEVVVSAHKYCFGVAIRDWEIDTISAEYDDIEFQRIQRYTADCNFEVPLVNQCTIAPHEYGEFAYWESTEKYPDNPELYDSSGLDIRIGDFTNPDYAVEFQTKYATGLNQDRFVLSDDTDFTCKNIRHFKFPDNKVSPFMYEYPQAGFTKALIYPLGLTIDETLINDFLNIAVNNGLITQEQRDSIIGYEVFRGDRSIDKSIIAKGLLYDMYKYTEDDKDILFPNFPYNDLGENRLLYDESRDDYIQHPFGSDSNFNFTFHSPDTEFYRPTVPSDLKIEGYVFGQSKGVFEDVEDHPKYVVLGSKAKSLASTLASLEVAAEAAIIAAESAEAYRVQVGLSNSANPIGIGLNVAATALNIISSAVFKYGRFKYQWLQTFRDLGAPQNFAKYYTSVGEYNYLQILQSEGNEIRGIQKSTYLRSGRAVVTNEVGGEKLNINNVMREESVFITLGSDYDIDYPTDYKSFDNKDINRDLSSRFHEGEVFSCNKGRSPEYSRNIASPYVSLKNYLPSQYGTIDSVDWLTTSYKGDLNNPKTDCIGIFGGDTFIARYTLKRKAPLFLITAMGNASKTPFNYKSYSNYGTEPTFYANFLSPDEVEIDRGFPMIETEYQFDCLKGNSSFYVEPPSKFYLYYYGIPSFLTETTINTNYRTAKAEPKDMFWPLVGDYVEWTQEKNVPIRERNSFFYNSVYSSNARASIGRTLPSTFSQETFDTLYDSPNGVIYSRPDNNENSLTEPWLTFRPLDKYDFKTAYGKLIDVRGIESGQVLARFESTTAIFNAFNTLVDDGSTPETQTLGDGFKRRPVTFSETELGYAGSQSSAMVSTEMGHFFVDAKRGQVFHTAPGGQNLSEISAIINGKPSGMRNWFKEHLPFKIKNPLVTNYQDIDVDNPWNGVGITMGWDSRYKRVFITKRDYKPLKPVYYANRGFYKPDGYDDIIATYEADGYTYEGIEGDQLKFSKEITGITDGTDVYAIFDTTSMQTDDGAAAATALQTWFATFQANNPTYTGNLYIIPYSSESYLAFSSRIRQGNIYANTSGTWATIAQLPPDLNTTNWVPPTEILLLAFVDESHSGYHDSSVSLGFDGGSVVQPTTTFFNDYVGFMDDITNHYTYFKAALYPIVQNINSTGGALVLQGLAALKGRTLTQAEINATNTTVDVSLLLTENPYENAEIPGSSPTEYLQPLEQLGWVGFFDKVSPASEVFSGEQFQTDLNNLVNVGGSVTEYDIQYVPMEKIELTDEEYFKDVSFTVAYNAAIGSWVSYYDFKPNYYISHNDYFQTGVNLTNDDTEFGLWSHLLDNRSFGVFYGKKYEVGLEYIIKNNYASKTLESLEVWAEAIRYHNDYDFAYNSDIMFNKLMVYNNREASGDLRLVPQKTLSDFRRYPKTNGNHQEILITNTNDRWNINYIYNRVLTDKWNQPILYWDENQIKKTINNDVVKFKGKRVLEPMRGDHFSVYLGYDKDSRFAVEFKWATNFEDIR